MDRLKPKDREFGGGIGRSGRLADETADRPDIHQVAAGIRAEMLPVHISNEKKMLLTLIFITQIHARHRSSCKQANPGQRRRNSPTICKPPNCQAVWSMAVPT